MTGAAALNSMLSYSKMLALRGTMVLNRRHLNPLHLRHLSLSNVKQFQVKSKTGPNTTSPTSPSGNTETAPGNPGSFPDSPASPGGATPESTLSPKKKSIKEQIILFYKNMWRDYREVFRDAYTEGKAKPWKTVLYSIIFGSMGYLLFSNPTEPDFDEECFQNRTKLALVGNPIRNPVSVGHVNTIEKLKIKGELRYQSFAFFSIIWRHDNSSAVGAIGATCSYLKPLLREVPERVVDIGLGNRWWISAERMADYDVNEREWEIADLIKARRILKEQQQAS